MSSFYKEGTKLNFEGIKGVIVKITETFKKNVLVVKVIEKPNKGPYRYIRSETIGIFEYPDGRLEFMSEID